MTDAELELTRVHLRTQHAIPQSELRKFVTSLVFAQRVHAMSHTDGLGPKDGHTHKAAGTIARKGGKS